MQRKITRKVCASVLLAVCMVCTLSAQRCVVVTISGHINAKRYVKEDKATVLLNKLPTTYTDFLSFYAQVGTRIEGMPLLFVASLSLYHTDPAHGLRAFAKILGDDYLYSADRSRLSTEGIEQVDSLLQRILDENLLPESVLNASAESLTIEIQPGPLPNYTRVSYQFTPIVTLLLSVVQNKPLSLSVTQGDNAYYRILHFDIP